MTKALVTCFPGVRVAGVELARVDRGTNDRAAATLTFAEDSATATAPPQRVFIKREGKPLSRAALVVLGAWDAEARLFSSGFELPLRHAEPYFAASAARRLASVIVMADVTAQGATPADPLVPLSLPQVRDGLDQLARLHARYWGAALPDWIAPWKLSPAWSPVSGAGLGLARFRLNRLAAGRKEEGLRQSLARPSSAGPLPDGLTLARIETGFRGWARIAASGPQTLLHGDPHAGNVYLNGKQVGFYDWQLVRSGSWIHDVGYFIASCLSPGLHRSQWAEMLGAYLDTMSGLGVSMPDRATAEALYHRSTLYGLGAWMQTLAGGVFQPREVSLLMIQRFAEAWTATG